MADAAYRLRDAHQRAAVCRRLLSFVGLQDLWREAGPSRHAEWLLSEAVPLPQVETVFLLAAWRVWADQDLWPLLPAFEALDPRLASGVTALDCVLRVGARSIDEWLASGVLAPPD